MKTVAVRTALLILIVLAVLVYGCKKSEPIHKLQQQPVQKTLAETLAGTYKMNGAWYETYWLYNAVSGTPYDTTVVLKSYTDTIITISVYNDSMLSMGGIPCSYTPNYDTLFTYFSDMSNTPGLRLTFYKNDTDSVTFQVYGYRSLHYGYFVILSGRRI